MPGARVPCRLRFIGDVHGAVLSRPDQYLLVWQSERGKPFDHVVQVGDLGVLPDRWTGDVPYDRSGGWDPAVYDLAKLILLDDVDATLPGRVRKHLARPILVTAGNHDEFAALRTINQKGPGRPQLIDPNGIFEYVPDGFVHQARNVRIGFCEAGDPGALSSRSADDCRCSGFPRRRIRSRRRIRWPGAGSRCDVELTEKTKTCVSCVWPFPSPRRTTPGV